MIRSHYLDYFTCEAARFTALVSIAVKNMFLFRYLIISIVFCFTIMSTPATAAILHYNASPTDWKLTGASEVIVLGDLYNVDFIDGTCTELFNGCDNAADFVFNTRESAAAASQALFDQVFWNVADLWQFDEHSSLIEGIDTPFVGNFITPWGWYDEVFFRYALAVNTSGCTDGSLWSTGCGDGAPGTPDQVYHDEFTWKSTDTSYSDQVNLDDTVFAVWSKATIPEPSSIALMGLGLLGFLAARRRLQK